MKRKFWTLTLAALGLLVLILDTRTAIWGATRGLELCIQAVIPSLLPFFVLSLLLTSSLAGNGIPILRPLGRLCGIVRGGESLLLIGMLGGYPAGAKCVAEANLRKWDAERMLAFCNLAGPAFLFGIVAGKFSDPLAPWALWGIHILSAITVAVLLPGKSTRKATLQPGRILTLSDALQRSLHVMANVCGWIILFRILIAFLERWLLWLLPIPAQVAVAGFLELSNGCCDLDRIGNESLRFIITAGMLAFGGLCVTMQTASAAKGLSLNTYLIGKLLQALLSILMASLLQIQSIHIPLIWWIVIPAGIAVTVKILHKRQNRCSISQLVGV